MTLRWTAIAYMDGLVLKAQAKSSASELLRRLNKDDPVWAGCRLVREKRWAKKHFRHGLAVRAFRAQDTAEHRRAVLMQDAVAALRGDVARSDARRELHDFAVEVLS